MTTRNFCITIRCFWLVMGGLVALAAVVGAVEFEVAVPILLFGVISVLCANGAEASR